MTYLKEIQEIAIGKAAEYFSGVGFSKLNNSDFPADNIVAAWQGNIHCAGTPTEIIVALTIGFPDELPKIYLTRNFQHLPIPHVDNNLFVCTFDTDSTDFFPERTERILNQTIEKARKIISDGLSGANNSDFETEFLAYWELGARLTVYSIFKPDDHIRILKMARVPIRKNKSADLIAENEKDIQSFAENLNPDIYLDAPTINFYPILYLPITVPFSPPFPKTNSELFALLDRYDSKYVKALLNFLKKNNYSGSVIFSVKVGGKYVVAGWLHKPVNIKEILKGFRPGNVNLSVIKSRIAKGLIERFGVDRIDSVRLQSRVGKDISSLQNKTVCIIGCGSIGSKIASALAQAGVSNFILIDKERLEADNVGRHLCGVTDIGRSKVDAISRRIHENFPCTSVSIIPKSFYKSFTEDQQLILSSNLIISATANPALERRLNYLALKVADFPSVLYSWIEPFGIACHAVLICNPKKSCFECCLDSNSLSYIPQVIKFERGTLTQQEAGCQSSFTPYSSVDADQAASIATRLALQWLSDNINQNTRHTFVGDTKQAQRMGLDISDMYKDVPSFTTLSSIIKKKSDCRACSGSDEYA